MKIERVIYEIYEGDGSLRVCAVMESRLMQIHCRLPYQIHCQIKQEGMRKTNFRPQSNPGLMTSKPAHQTLSHDHHVTGQFLTGF